MCTSKYYVPRAGQAILAQCDVIAILGLTVFYLAVFGPESQVHGPAEVFGQDTPVILQALADDVPYPWNPQNHLLYHHLIESGFRLWREVMPAPYGAGRYGAYVFLKVFTAFCGLAFLLALRWLFTNIGLGAYARAGLLLLTGLSVTAWFHFSSFESHALAAPFVCLYLTAVVALARRSPYTTANRCVLVVSLVTMGLVRIDLFRFAVVSLLLLAMPRLRRERLHILQDLVLVAVLGVAGQTTLSVAYSGAQPLQSSIVAPFLRTERESLAPFVARAENIVLENLVVVGRAAAVYSILMPVKDPEVGDSFFSWPPYGSLRYDPRISPKENPLHNIFAKGLGNFLHHACSLAALTLVGMLLLSALGYSVSRALHGDVLHVMIAAQWFTGLVFYTWFNPHEPFLWLFEFLPLQMAALAAALAATRLPVAWVPAAFAVFSFAHNWAYFYVPFG